ncbi:probable cytochrome P450 12a4, mitochondrial isoform X2 [Haliotis rubra]|nr:probable cytochrome P450 12a4, mitochondrial isoform X2 [Haliotis rubra]XP_046582083.1 probable cytochrome P450 12a4, mitochondrial isoform X2 [Haliotis rubra]XP_046582084.1 probable cytochrome P450 12a4, mitochondrial isoform X2 [Haliotis rubra]
MFKSRLTPLSAVKRTQQFLMTQKTRLKAIAASAKVDETDVKPFKAVPGPRGIYAVPMLGAALHMKPFSKYTTNTFHLFLDSMHEKYGRSFSMQLLGQCFVTEDPGAIETIYRNEGKYPRRATLNLFECYAENNDKERGMAVVNGPEWHRLRSATQAFMLKKTSASVYIDEQVDVANDLITRMSATSYTPEEFRDELFKYATESIGVVAFNKRLGFLDPKGSAVSSENQVYLHAIKSFFELMFKDLGPPLYKLFPTKLYKEFSKVANEAYGYGRVQIRELLETVDRQMKDGTFDPEKPYLILQLLASPKTTDKSVDAILLDLLTAGTDSTAKNMEILLLSLALNQDKQQKLYEEIVKVIGHKGHELTAEHISNMPYFRACMKESFRLHFPVTFGSLRILPEDVVVDGYLLPKGTCAFANNRRLLLNSEYFENPKQFLPERWLRDDSTLKREKEYPAFAFLPFGFGLRNCLGRRFAEQELWLGVTKIIQNFAIEEHEEENNFEMIYTTFGQVKTLPKFIFTPR